MEHLEAHLKTLHMAEAGAAFGKILTKELTIILLNKLA